MKLFVSSWVVIFLSFLSVATLGAGVPQALITQSDFLKSIASGESEADIIDVAISIQNGGTHYRFKFGLASEINCASPEGYSQAVISSQRLVKDISSVSEDEVVLCLVGFKMKNSTVMGEQPLSQATAYNWLRARASHVPLATITDPTFLSEIADGTSSMTSLNLPVNVRFGNAYQFKVGLAASTSCSDSSGYSAHARKGIPLVAGSLPDGLINLCLIGMKLKGSVIAAVQASPTVYSWTKESTPVTPPGPFTILSPSGIVTTQTPVFSWSVSEGAATYDLLISSDPDCILSVQSFTGLTQTSFTPSVPLADGIFYTCVKARNAAVDPTFASNSGLSFRVDATPPAAFQILGPSGNIGNPTPMVSWEESLGASGYHLVISKASDCSLAIQDFQGLLGTEQVVSELADGSYFICVSAEDEVGRVTQASNNGLSFTVDATPPQPFEILSPSGLIASSSPTVMWQASNGATAYDLVISSSSDCSSVVQQFSDLSANSQLVSQLADGTYFSCVTAKDTMGHSTIASNNGLSFTVDTLAPLPFNIVGPSGFISTATPTVSWQVAEGASVYELVISSSSDCSSVVQEFVGVPGTSQTVSELVDGSYFICVTALDSLNHETVATNNGLGFTVDTLAPAPFEIVSPTGLISDESPLVSWNVSDGAVSYDLVISTVSDCSVATQQFSDLISTSQELAPLVDGTYHICVTAKDEVGHAISASNNGLSFTIDVTAPLAFSILGPSGTITINRPTVSWEPSVDAISYDVVVSVSSDCSAPVQQFVDLTGTSQVLSALSDGTYFTCVTAEDAVGHVTLASNNGLMFTINTAPVLRHTIFVTSFQNTIITDSTFPPPEGMIGSLEGADWNCTWAAYIAGLISQWDGYQIVYKAVMSGPGINVKDRISVTAPVYNIHGDLVATSSADIWDGSLQNPILYDQSGTAVVTPYQAWTGSFSNGTATGNTCGSWNTQGSVIYGTVGDVRSKTGSWLAATSRTCNLSARLYCISPAHP